MSLSWDHTCLPQTGPSCHMPRTHLGQTHTPQQWPLSPQTFSLAWEPSSSIRSCQGRSTHRGRGKGHLHTQEGLTLPWQRDIQDQGSTWGWYTSCGLCLSCNTSADGSPLILLGTLSPRSSLSPEVPPSPPDSGTLQTSEASLCAPGGLQHGASSPPSRASPRTWLPQRPAPPP